MNTKYSQVKGPQGLPKTCKRQPPFCAPLVWPAATMQALFTYHGQSTIGSDLEIVEVIRPKLQPGPTPTWFQRINRPCFTILFNFETVNPGSTIFAAFDVIEAGVITVNGGYGPKPFQGVDPYDTLRRAFTLTTGTGLATFRVTL